MSNFVKIFVFSVTFTAVSGRVYMPRHEHENHHECCGLQNVDKDSHTACKAPSDDFASRIELDKEHILEIHRACRNNVDPPATDMTEIEWDDTLACVAQHHANQCPEGHDSYGERKFPRLFSYVGQNLALAWGEYTAGELTQAWCDEKENWQYGVGALDNDPSLPIGHFTQMVWSQTTHVGCGAARCKTDDMMVLVCNYGPAGNVKSPSNPNPKGQPYTA